MTTVQTFGDVVAMLNRPCEPIFYDRGSTDNLVHYNVSQRFITYPYQDIASALTDRPSNSRAITVNDPRNELQSDIDTILSTSQLLSRSAQFSHFIPTHQQVAGFLIDRFMNYSAADLITVASYIRDRINADLFFYSLTTALLHRNDVNVNLPMYAHIFPHNFISRQALWNCKIVDTIFPTEISNRLSIEIPSNFTGNDNDPEHLLAYFREDIGINNHHYHWHQIYPFEAGSNANIVVNKDRRGELFYYMHHQMVSRYNIERLCNNMDLTKRLLNWNRPLKEAYFPMLGNIDSGRTFSPRQNNLLLSDVNRPERSFDIDDLVRWRERIFDAVNRNRVILPDGSELDISNDQGIDILGNIIESSTVSVNRDYYGNIHNNGHIAIAFSHDPQNKYNQTPGVMYESATAMRDPIFYRWHAFIDDLFTEHKHSLPPYDRERDLNFPSIEIETLNIQSYGDGQQSRQADTLHTFMMKNDFNVERGLDFSAPGSIYVKVTHLNHEQFDYVIRVNNRSVRKVNGTVRIFMAPSDGVRGTPLNFSEQKQLMIEMDKFVVELELGINVIRRQSSQSSLISPLSQLFPESSRPINNNTANTNTSVTSTAGNSIPNSTGTGSNTANAANNSGTSASATNIRDVINTIENNDYCQCGWPENMLVPRGTVTGYSMVLFAMISDYEQDRVTESTPRVQSRCKDAMIFCGLKNRRYPDRRPMNYPFDRPVDQGIQNISQFLTPNMRTTPINIFFSEEVRDYTRTVPIDAVSGNATNLLQTART